MANITITANDIAAVCIGDNEFRDETLTFAGADTFVKGTILARRKVALVPTASAITGTGNGTLTSLSVVTGPEVPLVGAYVLTCITAVTHGGVWKLVDPNGRLVAGNLVMTASTGAATVFKAGGLQFTLTDGSTDFAAADSFTITVAADGKLVIYASAGAGGAQFPKAVLPYEVTKAGSGDLAVRVCVAGKVNKQRLVVDAGDTITNEMLDQLRSYGITPLDVQQNSGLDNS
jgi:hypothetical protein